MTTSDSYGNIIGGEELPVRTSQAFESLDPADGSREATPAQGTGTNVDAALNAARRGWTDWDSDSVPPRERGRALQRLGSTGADTDVTADLMGRHCESGHRLIAGIALAAPVVGDLIAVPVTGAYGYTLANNHNRALRSPIVFYRDGSARVAAERETYEQLLGYHRPAMDLAW